MALNSPQLLTGNVMHKRLLPKVNAFTYGIYYLAFPLSQIYDLPIAYNKPGALSFYDKDHGNWDGSNLQAWARDILRDYNSPADGEIVLICMPRVLGYVFNPVSFWLCHDKDGQLRAVLCEVHNTFGEKHTYVCAHGDHRPIERDDILTAEKLFHVSPMLEREGHYTFRFDSRGNQYSVWIDYYDGDGKKQLVTALSGRYENMTQRSIQGIFWRYPLVTFKAITLIHWQALKLLSKGIKYIRRPKQKNNNISSSLGITKN